MTIRIPCRRRDGSVVAYTIVDDEDAELASHRWHLSSDGYVARSTWTGDRFRHISLHREVLGLTFGDGLKGDHVNRDKLDNRRCNLRALTDLQHAQNQPSNRKASSKYRGVTWRKDSRKWVAFLRVNKQQMYFGMYESEEVAAEVARAARARLMPYAVD